MADILLSRGEVIDGTGAPRQPRTSVLVSGDRIVAVGGDADQRAANRADVRTIDVTGLTVMPGLIDAHTHVTLGEPASNDELFHHRGPASAALVAAYNLRKILRAGVTSILDVDGLFNIGPALRDAVASGVAEGPTMKSGTYALMTAVGGTAGRMIPDHGTAGYAEVVRDRDEMIRVVRRQVKDGADIIKIHVTGMIPTRSGELQVWTRDELRTVCDTAHDLGVPVTAHCRGDKATLDCALAGVDIIWHASYIGEAALEAVVERRIPIGPVFTFLANLSEYGAKAGATSSAQDVFRGEMEQTGAMLRRAYDAGVPLLSGSESGFSITPYGSWHARDGGLRRAPRPEPARSHHVRDEHERRRPRTSRRDRRRPCRRAGRHPRRRRRPDERHHDPRRQAPVPPPALSGRRGRSHTTARAAATGRRAGFRVVGDPAHVGPGQPVGGASIRPASRARHGSRST